MSVSEVERARQVRAIDHLVALGENSTAANILRRAFYGAWLAGDEPSLRAAVIDRSVAVGPTLPAHLWLERSIVDDSGVLAVARGIGATVMVEVESDTSFVRVTASTDSDADSLLDELVTAWGSAPSPELVNLRLWHGGTCRKRKITAPRWSDVARNYPPGPRVQLDQLMATVRPQRKGKLILWHGQPGTGKTSAIRALARAWSPWCAMQYIADPEQLFGDPNYLIQVLGAAPNPRSQATLDKAGEPDQAWQLIVAEDCDNYLGSATSQAGGPLGRILNLTDGLLGQGVNALLLLTTNEDAARLHPALTRPGRCLARVPFRPFSHEEASEWLGAPDRAPRGAATLAELLLANGDIEMNSTTEGTLEHTGLYL